MDYEKIIKKTLVFLLAGGKGQRLYPLTEERVKPAVPFGGKYRIIDFTLSNCVNSGLRKILVVTQYKSASLSRHLALGWGFLSDRFGEYITDIPPQQRLGERWYVGTADAVYQNLFFVKREESEYILILSGDHVYKMDYREMLEFHIEHKAEITIGAVLVEKERAKSFGIMQVDNNGKVVDFREKQKDPFTLPDLPDYSLASMGIYIFNRETLNKLLAYDAKIQSSSHDFGKDIIPFAISNGNEVLSYRFVDKNNKQKYWQDVGTIDSFYNANMDLLSPMPELNLYDKSWPFFTHARQLPPAKFTFEEVNGEKVFGYAKDSLIADGVIVEGGTILHSVIFPKVRIGAKSSISDSVIFNNTNIGENTRIKRAIIDKKVFVPENVEIGFNREVDEKYFYVSNSGIIVIPRGYRFPESFPRISI